MDNKLYRIEVIAWDNLPDINTTGMLYTDQGVAFVKLHPVKLNAKPKCEVYHGRWIWKQLDDDEFDTLVCSNCLNPEGARVIYNYCPNCGARMNKEN